MSGEDGKHTAHRALVNHLLTVAGSTTPEQRAHAFDNHDVPAELHSLIDKVVTNPAQISDADFAVAKAAGYSEDDLFELVVCAAVGHSARLYEAGLAALAQATADAEDR